MTTMVTEWKQRAYDGKWVQWGYVVDPNEDLEFWLGKESLIPLRWVILGVYDFLITLDKELWSLK